MPDDLVLEIPKFKEVYTSKYIDEKFYIICKLMALDDNSQLAWGKSWIKKTDSITPNIKAFHKLVAYGNAMRFLFLQIMEGEKIVEDKT